MTGLPFRHFGHISTTTAARRPPRCPPAPRAFYHAPWPRSQRPLAHGPAGKDAGEEERKAAKVAAPSHSITSSARSRSDSGIVSLIALAALRLMISSNLG